MRQEDIDRLLADIDGDAAVDMDHLDEDWDALAAGGLGDEEVAAMAAADPLAAEALRPLGEGFSARIRAELAVVPPPRAVAPVRPRWRWLPRMLVAATVLLAARVGMVAATMPADPPDYRLLAGQDEQPTRSEGPSTADATLSLSPGSRMRILLRPATQVDGATQAVAYRRDGTGWTRLSLPVDSDNGAHKIGGIVGKNVSLDAGEHTLLIGVGPAGPVGLLERALPVRGWRASFSDADLDVALTDPPPQWTFWQQGVIISAQ